MELSQLNTFQLVASCQSFSKAAQILHLTQPAITIQIKNLEAELGERLIERHARSLVLTPAGEVFLDYTKQILNLTTQACESIRQFHQTRGRLFIGAGTTNTIFRLPQLLQAYHQQYPEVEIQIRSGDSDYIISLVKENAIDLGFVTTIDITTNLEIQPLFSDQILLATPLGYPQEITPTLLAKESLILFRTGSGFRRYLDKYFLTQHFQPKVVMELESMEAMISFVQNGLGITFLPEIAIREQLLQQTIQTIQIKNWSAMTRQTYLVYRKDKYLSWSIRNFLTQILKVNSNSH